MFKKLLTALIMTVTICAACAMPVFAQESETPVVPPDETPTETPEVSSIDDVEFTFKYTSDSVVKEGMTYKLYDDPISEQSGIELVPDFGIGYTIVDDPETEIIDGIRINGQEVTSLRIPITEDTVVKTYEVSVKTVYQEGASGSIAQILDGTFDYTQLLTNPVIVFQLIYWVCMAVTGLFGIATLSKSKGQKVKTSDEIASKITENMDLFKGNIIQTVTDIVKAEILPLAEASVKSGQDAVKSVLLSNSKSKDAPLALLDVFKDSEGIDVKDIVDAVCKEYLAAKSVNDQNHADNSNALLKIASNVIQEDVKDEQNNKDTNKNQKSIF